MSLMHAWHRTACLVCVFCTPATLLHLHWRFYRASLHGFSILNADACMQLNKCDEAFVFRVPVDKLQVIDYYDIIKVRCKAEVPAAVRFQTKNSAVCIPSSTRIIIHKCVCVPDDKLRKDAQATNGPEAVHAPA